MPEKGNPLAPYFWYLQEVYERNYRTALERLSSTPGDSFVVHWWYYPKALLSGRAHGFLNEPELARVAYEEARLLLEKELRERPEDSRLHSSLGIAYAGLGRREDAVREGRRAVELLPVSKDGSNGPFRVQDLALIYTMVGEYDESLDQIDYLLSIPANFTVKFVELDPAWDPLRKHPRYEEILKKYR
jgi:serine/threonine-protein kinase